MRIQNFRPAGTDRSMRMANHARTIAMSCMVVAMMASCQKKGASKAQAIDGAKMEQMTKYLSVILNVSQDRIGYDQATDAFAVANTSLTLERKTVEAQYDGANEYKLNYENKN